MPLTNTEHLILLVLLVIHRLAYASLASKNLVISPTVALPMG